MIYDPKAKPFWVNGKPDKTTDWQQDRERFQRLKEARRKLFNAGRDAEARRTEQEIRQLEHALGIKHKYDLGPRE